mmetsp:Transcript_10990/g.25097  ORF Transcript_10990/g.25097 Transcript_10990/m.25097 type:complete len:476 (+) Transcript_10990:80-1507(+)
MSSSPLPLCYIALGGNVGDRLRSLTRALCSLRELEGVTVRRTSSLFTTKGQYVAEQPPFLNAIVEVELSQERLDNLPGVIDALKGIEASVGRTPGVRRGPRVVDLDIVAVGEQTFSSSSGPYPLEVPHQLMHERDFVLVPMAQLAPEWRHPLRPGNPTVKAMLEALKTSESLPAGASLADIPVQVIPAAGGLHGRSDGALFHRGEKTLVMGILNATPDSFSDGGDHLEVEAAVAAAVDMVTAGADILDIGGESTRPGAAEVPPEEEIKRVAPVVKALRECGITATISVDTRKAAVAKAAVEAGADWINDVSGGEFDPDMLRTAAELMAPVVLMHMRGTPATMKSLTTYDRGVTEEVMEQLEARRRAAEAAGVATWNIMLDPGIGFAKEFEHNLELLRRCGEMVERLQPAPILIGTSRKRFIGTILNEPEPKKRVFGNAATVTASIAGNADIVRVHEVLEMVQTARVSDKIYRNCV